MAALVALTTAQAFKDFHGRLLLTEKQKLEVVTRQALVVKHLTTAFPATSNLPLGKTDLIGSASRGTLIRPPDDIDVMAVFSNKDGNFESYRHNSRAFLYRIRDALNRHSRVEVVGARGQAVRFFYAGGSHVDVAPMFRWNSGGLILPDGAGGWLRTDPVAQAVHLADRNRQLDRQLTRLTRMLKRWNVLHSKRLKSFHLEVVAATCFKSLSANSRVNSDLFFGAAHRFVDVSDPAGHGGLLSSYLTPSARADVVRSFESAHARATRARAAEGTGDHAESIRLWRLVYGKDVPAYG